MAAVTALNGRNFFGETVIRQQTAEEKALDFFRRADFGDSFHRIDSANNSGELVNRQDSADARALEFFQRAELRETLEGIWQYIKRQRFGTVLKLMKAVALVTAVILLGQSISIGGLIALAGSIAGLLFATITNAFVLLLYIPLYFFKPTDFASSVLFAIGLAWLGGVSPLLALGLSPVVVFGFRMVDRSELAQAQVSDVLRAIGQTVEKADLGRSVQNAADKAANIVASIFPQGNGKHLFSPGKALLRARFN